MNTGDFIVEKFGDRNICVGGVGKMFYQEGFPLSISVEEFSKQDIDVSLLHVVEEFWNNGWSWKTVEMKLRGELEGDINKVLKINFGELMSFYHCLEQPQRSRGGYEKSREMIFQYLFGCSTNNVRKGVDINPINWLREKQ